ncbi:MAG: lytic transglycosylase domain-containing protein [Sphingomicrobium sp.]
MIQIDSEGNSQTFAAPTVFNSDQIVLISRSAKASEGRFDIDRTIAEASRIYGVDRALLQAVAQQESGRNSAAVSPKGARGVMQLMPATAAQLGVRINDASDNIHGGAIYLRQQIDRFGSVPLALAAYNAGPGAVVRYSGIPPYRETRNYVSRIMARWKPVATNIPVSMPRPVPNNVNVIEVP